VGMYFHLIFLPLGFTVKGRLTDRLPMVSLVDVKYDFLH
jgi:hypothetical protein